MSTTIKDSPDKAESPIDSRTVKCIRCGFCLDACPTFRLTGKETLSPRGRIYLVRSWREGAIPFDSDVVEALDSCLGCRACETACPSGVEYGAILELAREHIEDAKLRPGSQSFARAQLLATLTSPGRLTASLKAAGLVGKLTGNKMPAFAARLLSGSSEVSVPLPAGEVKTVEIPERIPPVGTKRSTVGLLAGCVMRVMFGDVNRATVRVLQANGCEIVAPRAAGCCGALHLHSGFHSDALERAKRLIDSFDPYLDELDAIIVNSAGCGSTMKEYGDMFADDPVYRTKSIRFAARVKDVSEWLIELGVVTPDKQLNATVTYHDACHLAHGQKVRSQPRRLLQTIPGLNLVELNESDTCCGSAGIYNLTEPVMARRLLERKVENLKATGATIVATGNPGCLAWIREGAREAGLDLRICHPVELLDEAYS